MTPHYNVTVTVKHLCGHMVLHEYSTFADKRKTEAQIRRYSAKQLCDTCQFKARRYRLTKVTIDGPTRLAAYIIDNQRWNGWVIPFFTREQLPALLEWQNSVDDYTASFDVEHDTVITKFADEEPDLWEKTQITVEGETLDVYPVGAMSWIWMEAT